jgi:hypothetical protein
MNEVLIIILLIIIVIVAMLVIPQWLTKRAIPQVIRIFREKNAIGIKNAKTVDELGLRPRGMMEQMFRRRDYKQYALTALMRVEIIQMTEDGRLYLSEEKLSESGLNRPTPYFR